MKIPWRDRDASILIGGMQDSFEIDAGMQIKQQLTLSKFKKAGSR